MSGDDRIQVSIPVEKLMMLLASGELCVADLCALDMSSHDLLRQAALTVCAQQLKGMAKQCQTCTSRTRCQQVSQVNEYDVPFAVGRRVSLPSLA